MNTVNKQTAFALKEAGFPQPNPAFGQVWYHLDGSLHVVMKKGEFHTITRYIQDDRVCAGFFNDEAVSEMAFAPGAWEILFEIPGKELFFGLFFFTEADIAARYMDINKAERV